jgi:hypothetical protein
LLQWIGFSLDPSQQWTLQNGNFLLFLNRSGVSLCLSAPSTFMNAVHIKKCLSEEEGQYWQIREYDAYVLIESLGLPGYCMLFPPADFGSPSVTSTTCTSNYSVIVSDDYCLVQIPYLTYGATHHLAMHYCQSFGGTLVIYNSKTDQVSFKSVIPKGKLHTPYWIGLEQPDISLPWTWGGVLPLTYTSWIGASVQGTSWSWSGGTTAFYKNPGPPSNTTIAYLFFLLVFGRHNLVMIPIVSFVNSVSTYPSEFLHLENSTTFFATYSLYNLCF